MNRYKYEVNPDKDGDLPVIRTLQVTYPEHDTIDDDMSKKLLISTIKDNALLYAKGLVDSSICDLENKWYDLLVKESKLTLEVVNKTDELKDLNEKLTSLELSNSKEHLLSVKEEDENKIASLNKKLKEIEYDLELLSNLDTTDNDTITDLKNESESTSLEITDIEEALDNVNEKLKEFNTLEDKISTIEERLKVLEGHDESIRNGLYGAEETVHTPGILEVVEKDISQLEDSNPWLLRYKGETIDDAIVRPEPSLKTVISDNNKKRLIAYDRDTSVRDVNDSIADVAKMVSLSFSIISELWDLVPDADKENIDGAKKDVIDYSVTKFKEIQTRADRQLSKEGTNLVDKLFNREVAIADVIDNINKDTVDTSKEG